MEFDIDVLIIYSTEDNHQVVNDNTGWADNFKKFLELMLIQVLGEEPNVMLKSEHDSITGANLKKVATIVPILSPSMMASGELLDTVEAFYTNVKKDEARRVFKVCKMPVAITDQPSKLAELIGYDLFDIDNETGEAGDVIDFFSADAERSFWMKMVDMAYDIHESLLKLNTKTSSAEVKHIFERRTIYLAETGYDLNIQRNIIKRELQRRGYKVLPDHTLPRKYESLKAEIERELEQCSLSIHLIGSSYGEIPEGSERSIVDIQNEITAERSIKIQDKSKFSRLIWVSNQLNHASERQLSFIDNIKRDLASSEGTEILQTALEDFKSIIREELIEVGIDKKLGNASKVNNDKLNIYVLHDKVDEQKVVNIKEEIEKAGYNVLTPIFEGDLLALRQDHINNLRNFDAAIIFQSNVNNQWVKMKLLDLLKAPGFGRQKTIKGKAIISDKEEKLDISAYKNYNVTLIHGEKKTAIDELKGFLEEIKQ